MLLSLESCFDPRPFFLRSEHFPSSFTSPPLYFPSINNFTSITSHHQQPVPLRFCYLSSRKTSIYVSLYSFFSFPSSCVSYHSRKRASCAPRAASLHQQQPLIHHPPCRVDLTLSDSEHILSRIIIMAAKATTTTRAVSYPLSYQQSRATNIAPAIALITFSPPQPRLIPLISFSCHLYYLLLLSLT